MTPVVLASSPLVGRAAMGAVAEQLHVGGRAVSMPAVPFALDSFTDSVVAACQSADAAPVVVGYSAAGPRLFHVASRVESHARVAALVFLDARLPAAGVAPDAEPRFAELLDALPRADDGTLPPWPRWWPPEVLAGLVPDADARERLIAGCERPPRSMFSQPIPAPDVDVPCGFLALGDGYAADTTEAARRGWPVRVIDGADHLWPITHADAVAAGIIEMVDWLAP